MQLPKTLPEVIQYVAEQEQQRVAARLADAQQKVLTLAYDKAAAYTTVIVFGGYAGFFALWQLTKEHLTKGQALWSAVLVLVSMLAFVLFEVLKMVLVTKSVFQKAAVLRDPNVRSDPQRLISALEQVEQAQSVAIGPLVGTWVVVVVVALAGAIGGAGILGYAFISGLAK